MSLITRCPACGTMFKVVTDQLRISEGWVRCGQCSEVFDATVTLHGAEETTPSPLTESAPQRQAAPPAQTPRSDFRETEPPSTPASPLPSAPPVAAPPAPALAVPAPPAIVAAPAPSATARADAVDSIDAPPLYPSFPSEVHDSQLQRESRAQEEEPDLDRVSFVQRARRKALWRRPLVRVLLLLIALLLGVLLAAQYGWRERDRLAAQRPALRPWLQWLCEPLRCEVGAPRQIDAIVIDSSSFVRLRADVYRLSFTVRNQAPTQVAMPSLELTLTDTQDQPVIRRVLNPRDVGSAGVIQPAGDASASISIAVTANGGSGRVAGYRLLAFYP